MKHTWSSVTILLLIGISYFIFSHDPFSQKASAHITTNQQPAKVTPSTHSGLNPSTRSGLTPSTHSGLPTVSPRTSTPTPQASPSIVNPSKSSTSPTPAMKTEDNTGLDSIQTYLLSQVNQYRKSLGLGEVASNKTVCDFATTRAGEIVSNFSHSGFDSRIQNKTLPYPSYTFVTENIAMDSNYQDVVPMWVNSSGHAANMRAETPYVCIAYSGNYFAYEGFKP